MSRKKFEQKLSLPRRLINIQDPYLNSSIIMDLQTVKNQIPAPPRKSRSHSDEAWKTDSRLSGGHSRRMCRYFTLESLFLLVCLTASLLILPLILPPLPPPPLMLLLLPICILAVLMVLAFMPTNVREATYTYM